MFQKLYTHLKAFFNYSETSIQLDRRACGRARAPTWPGTSVKNQHVTVAPGPPCSPRPECVPSPSPEVPTTPVSVLTLSVS